MRSARLGRRGIARACKGKQPPAAIGLHGVAELNRPGVGDADHRRGMKAHADRQALGEMLMRRLAGQQGRAIARRRAGGVAAVLDEIALRLGGIGALSTSAMTSRPFAIEVDQLLGDGLTLAE